MTDGEDLLGGSELSADQLATALSGDGYADAAARLLAIVRTQLGMQAAWIAEVLDGSQVLRFLDAGRGAAPDGASWVRTSTALCAGVLDGRLPQLTGDVAADPEVALVLEGSGMPVGSYVAVPLWGAPGVAVGVLCAVSVEAAPSLGERDLALARLIGELLHDVQSRAQRSSEASDARDRLRRVVTDVIGGAGRHAVLQPVVDLTTGRAVAAEGLTRFTAESPAGSARTPAQWFDDAARLGLGQRLEVATAGAVLDLLDGPSVPADVAVTINLGPQTITSRDLPVLLDDRPLDRVVIEMTEHAQVEDYARLDTALRPYRDEGLQVAVDDAGAGYASLRHVLAVSPDLLKVDMALIRGVDTDVARQTLLSALTSFSTSTGCRVVAEGVETAAELRAVRECGVDLAQGYLLARPSATPSWEFAAAQG